MSKPQAIIVDLDGTLAHIGDRHPWHGHLCHTDTCHEHVAVVLRALFTDYFIIILSGRSEVAREPTEAWLDRHGIDYDDLYLRAPDEYSPAAEYKLSRLTIITETYDVLFALDDDPTVVRAFRDAGIPCFHVADWTPHE